MKVASLPEEAHCPEISILMTVYNTEAYLGEAIESVLQQNTCRTWELIVVDDGSTDGSLALAKSYAAKLSQCIRILQHPDGLNRGISESRNLAMFHARGEYLAFLDSDDVWLPDHLETQAEALEQRPGVAMVYASAERWVHFAKAFSENKARAAWWGDNYLPALVPDGEKPGLLQRGKLLEWFTQDESMVPCICTVLVRTSAARAVRGFCNEFRGLYDDQAFHAKISLNYSIYAHDVCVARYRQHAASCCGVSQDGVVRSAERQRFRSFLNEYAADRLAVLAP